MFCSMNCSATSACMSLRFRGDVIVSAKGVSTTPNLETLKLKNVLGKDRTEEFEVSALKN